MRLFCEMCAEKMRSNCGGDDYPATVVSFLFPCVVWPGCTR